MASVEFQVKDEYGLVQPALTQFGETILLQASIKQKDRDGRIYQITATATDQAGRSSSVSRSVVVRRHLGHRVRETEDEGRGARCYRQ